MKRFFVFWSLGMAVVCYATGLSESTGCTASAGPQTSAAIQATARVVPLLGLTEINSVPAIEGGMAASPQPGSHLFWLYYPRTSGVQVQVDGAEESRLTSDGVGDDRLESDGLRFLNRYSYASVLEWAGSEPASPGDGPVTITVVFTDN